MDHPGFAIVHIQSPCTTYNDNYEELKGDKSKGIDPLIWDIPADHDPSDRQAAHEVIQQGGVPLGIIYRRIDRISLDQRLEQMHATVSAKSVEELLNSFAL